MEDKPAAAIWRDGRIWAKKYHLQREPDGGCNAHHLYQLPSGGLESLIKQVSRGFSFYFQLLCPAGLAIGTSV
jgi:hypothetical protein